MSRWQRNADAFAELLVSAAGAMRASPWRRGSAVHLPRRGRLLATGDLHDNQLHLDAVLRAARLDAPRPTTMWCCTNSSTANGSSAGWT
jgi:hypothetical protein